MYAERQNRQLLGQDVHLRLITDRLKHNYKGAKDDIIKMLSGESIKVNVTRYMNTMTDFHSKDDVFTYLIHLGYLAYNSEDETCRIPNLEVRKEWYNAIEDMPDYSKTDEIIKASEELQRTFAFGSHQLRRGDENPYVQD